MDVKEAVKTARRYAAEVFEGVVIRIEEVWFDQMNAEWCVTIGLQRPEPESGLGLALNIGKARPTRMHYKSVRISEDTKEIKSVRNHDTIPVSPL